MIVIPVFKLPPINQYVLVSALDFYQARGLSDMAGVKREKSASRTTVDVEKNIHRLLRHR